MVGSIAMASGFATYLGVYSSHIRQHIVETVWPKCLEDRGIISDINIANNLTVDITMSMAKIGTDELVKTLESTDSIQTGDAAMPEDQTEEGVVPETAESHDDIEESQVNEDDAVIDEAVADETRLFHMNVEAEKQMDEVESLITAKDSTSPYVYDQYVLGILKLLIGDEIERNLTSRGCNYRKLEDASIFYAANQTPLLIIDPFNAAMQLLESLLGDLTALDMSHR